MKYAIKVLHHDAMPKLNDLKSALPALKYHENHRKFIPIVLQGTIHILRKHFYSKKLDLTSNFFTKIFFCQNVMLKKKFVGFDEKIVFVKNLEVKLSFGLYKSLRNI